MNSIGQVGRYDNDFPLSWIRCETIYSLASPNRKDSIFPQFVQEYANKSSTYTSVDLLEIRNTFIEMIKNPQSRTASHEGKCKERAWYNYSFLNGRFHGDSEVLYVFCPNNNGRLVLSSESSTTITTSVFANYHIANVIRNRNENGKSEEFFYVLDSQFLNEPVTLRRYLHELNIYQSIQPASTVDSMTNTLNIGQLLLMPESKSIQFLQQHVWPYMATLFKAAMAGIRDVQPDAKFGTHLAFASSTFISAFYDTMVKADVHFDTLGISFYPTSKDGPSVAQFKNTVLAFQNSRKIPVYVEELAFANRAITNPQAPFYGWDQPSGKYKISSVDQSRFLSNLVGWAHENGLAGVKYYGSDMAVSDLWLELSLFSLSSDGTAVPLDGLKSFQEGLLHSCLNAEQFQ